MANLPKIAPVPTPQPVVKGFSLCCPFCGNSEAEATVRVSLNNVNDLFCTGCEAEFTLQDVRRIVRQWSAALAWLDSCPALDCPE